jgi:enterochelin esterase-like enzyme
MTGTYTMKRALLYLIAIGFILSTINLHTQQTGSFDVSVLFNGDNRKLSLYVPSDYDAGKEYQLLVGLHGMGDESSNFRNSLMNYLNWNTVFQNTIFIFPDGGGDRGRDFYSPPGDEEIITKAIDYAKENYNIADGEVIIEGFSLGGRSALKYGLDHPEIFNGLLLHTPAMQGLKDPINITPASLVYNYDNAKQVPIVITHGSDDILYVKSIQSLVEQLVLHDNPLMYNYINGMGHSIPPASFTNNHIAFFNSPGSESPVVDWINVIKPDRVCTNTFTPTARVRNSSKQPVLSIEFECNSPNESKTFSWQTPQGMLSTFEHLDVELPALELSPGFNSVFITITKINGEEYTSEQAVYEFTIEMVDQGHNLPDTEGFEYQSSLQYWYIDASYHWTTWGLDSDVKRSGTYSVSMFNTLLLVDNMGISEDLLSPYYDLTQLEEPELSFDLAFNYHLYTEPYYNPDLLLTDTLKVLISTDCGETYQTIYHKYGKDLATADNPIVNPTDLNQVFFIPNSNQWRKERVSLENYKDNDMATLTFRYTSGLGGSIYIDNVSIAEKEVTSVENEYSPSSSIYPNPADDRTTLAINIETTSTLSARMLDITGRTILNIYDGKAEQGLFTKQIDLYGIPSGVYLIELQIDGSRKVEKLIVK